MNERKMLFSLKDSNKLRCGREKVISCPALYRDW
jgi:hypothetical protein